MRSNLMSMSVCLSLCLSVCSHNSTSWLTPADLAVLRHAQSSSCCARSWNVECDRQATVVGRLLTTLGDNRRAVAKFFLVHRLEKSSRGNCAYFGDSRISYLFDIHVYYPVILFLHIATNVEVNHLLWLSVDTELVDDETHLLSVGVTTPWHFSIQCSFIYTAGRKTDKGSRLRVHLLMPPWRPDYCNYIR